MNAVLSGKPYGGNPHVWFDEGEVASEKPRRGLLFYKARLSVLCLLSLIAFLLPVAASETTVRLRFDRNGVIEERTVEAASRTDGMTLILTPEEAGPFTSLEVVTDFAIARKGESGYFVLPNNLLGTFRLDEGKYELAAKDVLMSFWGMKTPRKTFVTEVKGLRWDWTAVVRVSNGKYELVTKFVQENERPYEDIVIDWTFLPNSAEYPDMAKVYRQRRLDTGIVSPLTERVKERPVLGYAAEAIEVRLRMAWKPAPATVMNQNEFNEPPLKVAITFDRASELISRCHQDGLDKAEFCLVGWKYRGHDGCHPQIWPVCPELGGLEAMKRTISTARACGYNIVAHTCFTDAYTRADCWDEADCIKLKNGELDFSEYTWSGGKPYKMCLQRAWERYAVKDMGKLGALGFRGLHFFDVATVEPLRRCLDRRHPCTKSETAKYLCKYLREAARNMGGVGSEGAIDFAADSLDYALYVSYEIPGGSKLDPMMDRLIPLWQLVYHGIILSMPFTECTNYTIHGDEARLAMVEFGGRPMFYVNSDFMTGLRWMGEEDLLLETEDDLRRTVRELKRGAQEYAKLSDLQFCFMDDHKQLAPGVVLTVYSNGTETIVNRSDHPFTYRGRLVSSHGWERFDIR